MQQYNSSQSTLTFFAMQTSLPFLSEVLKITGCSTLSSSSLSLMSLPYNLMATYHFTQNIRREMELYLCESHSFSIISP